MVRVCQGFCFNESHLLAFTPTYIYLCFAFVSFYRLQAWSFSYGALDLIWTLRFLDGRLLPTSSLSNYFANLHKILYECGRIRLHIDIQNETISREFQSNPIQFIFTTKKFVIHYFLRLVLMQHGICNAQYWKHVTAIIIHLPMRSQTNGLTPISNGFFFPFGLISVQSPWFIKVRFYCCRVKRTFQDLW